MSVDPANPYQPPSAWSEASKPYGDYPFAQRRGILWMLFSFRGRIGRAAFWGCSLLAIGLYYAGLIPFVIFLEPLDSRMPPPSELAALTPLLIIPLAALVFWMSIAIQVKRWHDHDMSGWWWFVQLVPLIGPIVVLVQLGCMRGTIGHNSYGPDPT